MTSRVDPCRLRSVVRVARQWAAIGIALATVACGDTTTTVRLREAKAVHLATNAGPYQVTSTEPSQDEYGPRNGRGSNFTLRVTEAPEGGPELHWESDSMMLLNERRRFVRADGTWTSEGGADRISVVRTDGQRELRIQECASLVPWCASRKSSCARTEGYEARFAPTCAGDVSVPYTLTTPTTNVMEIREQTHHARVAPAIVLVATTLSLGIPGLVLASYGGPKPAVRPVGYALLAVVGAVDLFALYGLFVPNRDQIVPVDSK